MSSFLLPKGCLKRMKAMCSKFLWSCNIDIRKGAKVSWQGVCLPKKEGWLGLRRFTIWNKTLCLRLVWMLFSNNSSLWARWHKFHHLRNNSLWELEESSSDTWPWRMLLLLKPLATRFLRCIVGNRRLAHLWHDTLTPFGPLIKLLGPEEHQKFQKLAMCMDGDYVLLGLILRSDYMCTLPQFLSQARLLGMTLIVGLLMRLIVTASLLQKLGKIWGLDKGKKNLLNLSSSKDLSLNMHLSCRLVT